MSKRTEKGYAEVEVGGVFDASYLTSQTRRGRVQQGGAICPTIMCSSEILLYEGIELCDKR